MSGTRRIGRGAAVEPSNATELLLRSGRRVSADGGASTRDRLSVDVGLEDLGHRLGVALIALGPHRASGDERLRRAYRSVHAAMGDLAGVLALISVSERLAPRARRGRHPRPWGARS
jgi:hypothetical protein